MPYILLFVSHPSIYVLIILLNIFGLPFCNAQQNIYINEQIDNPDITVQINTNCDFPDIKVQFGEYIPFKDFTVGITDFESRANFIIVNNPQSANKQVKIDNCANFPDLKIQYGNELPFPDIRIEFRNNGLADYLIYTENILISEKEALACLLPLILEKIKK